MAARRPRRPTILSPAVWLRTNAVRKGVLGGERTWQGIAALIFGRQLLHKMFGRNVEVVATERLDPGQSIHITALAPERSRRR